MKRDITTISVFIVFLLFAITASAKAGVSWRGSGGWGAVGQYSRIYDPKTTETITGEVTRIDTITPLKGMSYGIHLVLQTDRETISVHLGPSWYIERLDMKLHRGDSVTVTGSRVAIKGRPLLIAAELKKGEAVLKLRDENGVPVWAGWRK